MDQITEARHATRCVAPTLLGRCRRQGTQRVRVVCREHGGPPLRLCGKHQRWADRLLRKMPTCPQCGVDLTIAQESPS